MINTFTSYNLIARDLSASLQRVREQPIVQRETEYYLENISTVKTIEAFVENDRLFRYAMKAHGLEDMAYAKAMMVKALEEGIDDDESFANSLTDRRYHDFVETFNFERYGDKTTSFYGPTTDTVNRYTRQTLEEDAGKRNEGVQLALYFQRKAPDLSNYYEILADRALSEVVRTALGFPPALAQADIDKQAALIEEKLDLADLKEPEKLEKFLQRFTSLWEISHPSTNQQSSIAALYSQPPQYGISSDMLLTIAQLKR